MQSLKRLLMVSVVALIVAITFSYSVFAGDVDDPYGRRGKTTGCSNNEITYDIRK